MGACWTDYSSDLFELIADEYVFSLPLTLIAVGGFQHIAIAKITSEVQDLPDSAYIGGAFCKAKAYIPLSICVKTAEDLNIQQNTVDTKHVVLSLPHLAIPV